MLRHLEALLQLFDLFFIVTGQALGQAEQAVFQITIVVERLDQKTQCSPVGFAQALRQNGRLPKSRP
jgi:hypothetical protein